MNDPIPLDQDEDDSADVDIGELDELDIPAEKPEPTTLSAMPMFQALFAEAVAGDSVLEAFAAHVVGELSDRFALKAAKGGAFFQEREAEGIVKNTQRFQRDQSLRAHLINGMLPALHVARHLAQWGAPVLRDWDETHERLFIAGYMLHDYTKIDDVKKALLSHNFKEGEAPSERQIPVLEAIFREWCKNLGLEAFLQPIGGVDYYLQDLIYIACNTQRLKGTLHATSLLPRIRSDEKVYFLVSELSRLADLIAYIAPTPRELVANESIRTVIKKIAIDKKTGLSYARLVYHHVAENRGLLLNFIHNAVLHALTIEDVRVPLLYAPSGVVYLERHTAPDMPAVDDLVIQVVEEIRKTAGETLINTGKGAKRGNTFLQVDDSYNDFFSLPEMIAHSMKLVSRYIRNNKTPDRFKAMADNQWTGWDNVPAHLSTDPKDGRADQIAEWAGFIEAQFRERFNKDTTAVVQWLLEALGITDLKQDFFTLKSEATKGGLRYWWHWGAAHALARKPPMDETAVQEWLHGLSHILIAELPEELPANAQANQETWLDLADYVKCVLTIGGTKGVSGLKTNELEQYTRAKARSGKAICAICGSDYPTRKPAETAVAFQPGVYTQRIRIGASDNKRNLCSICATEQLLRQLFLDNLETGSKAETQRIRYLSFYPSYFFSPETLEIVQRAYNAIKTVRLSDSGLWRALRDQESLTDAQFWQRLDSFLLYPEGETDDAKFKRVLRFSHNAQSTYFTVGFRNLDPTETESWVLPAFLAFVMAVCLDVKVVASDSGVPLMLESSELPETLWFDGAHAAIQSIIQHDRLHIDNVGKALARLTAAYLIHLDAEYVPPKENWQRFVPIANALCESPLYVFYYLKKQERDERPLTQEKVRRYIGYAQLFAEEGDPEMSHAKELVRLYRGFYRAKTTKNANSILRPLSVVSDALLVADPRLFTDRDALVEVAYGELYRFMDRVGKGLADGRFPKGVSAEERQTAMRDFSAYFVTEIFQGAFGGDVASLRGKQLNLLKSACEVLYRDAQAQEWAERGRDAEETDDETDES